MAWRKLERFSFRCKQPPTAVSAFFATCRPRLIELPTVGVEAWVIALPSDTDCIGSLLQVLDAEERTRGEEFHRASDRAKYVSAHAALRIVLAHYAGCDPHDLCFHPGEYGKPAIDRSRELPDIRFNLSHSGDLAAIAVTEALEVGIDIERIEPARANTAVAKRFFSDREVSDLMKLREEERTLGFFNCWTRKEAYIKARGEGLSLPLDCFAVSLAPGSPPELLASRTDPLDVDQWQFCDVPVDEGYVASLVVRSPDAPIPGNVVTANDGGYVSPLG
jgi:4'-phosphopantetheinyl transferase